MYMCVCVYSRQMYSEQRGCQQACAVPERQHARAQPSMWKRPGGRPRLSGVKLAAVPLWHANLYGQLTLAVGGEPSPPAQSLWHPSAEGLFVCPYTSVKL